MTGHPLRPVSRLSLGKPLPYQLADSEQTHLEAPCGFGITTSPVLLPVSQGYPELRGKYPLVTHPFAARLILLPGKPFGKITLARLACLKHAANVHPEPGSNSQ